MRIEINLTENEAKALSNIAKLEGRSRKNFCENELRKIILKQIALKKRKSA